MSIEKRVLLSAILVLAVILCHGALGALHEPGASAGWTAVTGPTMEHSGNSQSLDYHGSGANYYAVALLVALMGSVIVLLGVNRWYPRLLSRDWYRNRILHVARSSVLRREPTAPLLQVFRL